MHILYFIHGTLCTFYYIILTSISLFIHILQYNYTGRFLGVRKFKNLPKIQFATFFNRKKSIFSVGLCAIHTMFQKLKIIKTVEMPCYLIRTTLFLKVLTTLKIRKKSNLQLFLMGKKHLLRVPVC